MPESSSGRLAEEWKVKVRNAFTRKWSTLARGSEEFCRSIYFVQSRSLSIPFDDVKLIPPRTR